ncbi:hypothetical protein GCM10023200_44410 [Actinomycetospora chlora]|uniref:Uncharacterized protein n=1 Tax=Actinomycetospora chlora TaxID=663608 RepID=A0ABP9C3E5_9PSEU
MTRAPGPAAREPGEDGGTRASTSGPDASPDAPTVAFRPSAPPPSRPAPAVPEVPALADIAAPGRPAVEAVVTPEEPPAPGRRRRPSRHMRARADEMARLLARAAPSGRTARRGLHSLPAAAAVLTAVAVGGVGIALGLDAQRAGQQLALPQAPTIPDGGTPVPEPGGSTTVTRVDAGIVGALVPRPPADAGAPAPRPSSAAATAPRTAPAVPRATTPTTRPRPTPTTARSTTPRPTTSTPRSTTSPRPTPRAEGPAAGRDLGDLDRDDEETAAG